MFDPTLTGNNRLTGFAIELWKTVLDVYIRADLFNISYDFYNAPDGEIGVLMNGTWSGMVGEMVRGNADSLAQPLGVSRAVLIGGPVGGADWHDRHVGDLLVQRPCVPVRLQQGGQGRGSRPGECGLPALSRHAASPLTRRSPAGYRTTLRRRPAVRGQTPT